MKFLYKHWFDLGAALGVLTLTLTLLHVSALSEYQLLMWLSLATLFFHQFEEYRLPGTFPGMVNGVMFQSELPDRYPLNSRTSFIINVAIGWTLYILAALGGESFIWLGMASILVSLGNIMAHTFLFNLKGKTLYNAGLLTSWLLFAPCVFFFFKIIEQNQFATPSDYLIGIPLGIAINVFGVFKPITWLADRNTIYLFSNRQLLPRDRKV